ncbi:unnamed protein product [Protopolystoma xenopodis]|uniref:Uncharacterized protein n=1 Tax=Protopolystoma xenopodis TaxID=117903 RepID=A0A448WV08_9PLAT|nr:unnamed protein product [Protopolystoma xenopodis]
MCAQRDPCESGKRQRKISCFSLRANGGLRRLSLAACYSRRIRPPPVWERCFLQNIGKCSSKAPVIEEDRQTVVQMREVR